MLNAMHHLTAEDLASVRGDLISRGGEPASERDGDRLADLGNGPDWVWEPTDEEMAEMARRAEMGERTLECFVCDGLGCTACAQTGYMTVDEFLSEPPLPPMPATPQPDEDEDDPEFEYESADDWAIDEYGLEHDDLPYYEID